MIPTLAAAVVIMAGLSVTTTYIVVERHKRKMNSESMDFKCPECGISVDGNTKVCPECMAEFKENEFACPVCGSAVSADTKSCTVCKERFEEDETFLCPNCNEPIASESVVCAKCDSVFWSPVKPPDVTDVEVMSESEEANDVASEASST